MYIKTQESLQLVRIPCYPHNCLRSLMVKLHSLKVRIVGSSPTEGTKHMMAKRETQSKTWGWESTVATRFRASSSLVHVTKISECCSDGGWALVCKTST